MRLLTRYRRYLNSKSQHARLKKSDQGRKGMDLPMFTPPQIAEKLGDVCQGKCRTPMKKFFVLAILAGAFIAFGAQLSILVGSDATLGLASPSSLLEPCSVWDSCSSWLRGLSSLRVTTLLLFRL